MTYEDLSGDMTDAQRELLVRLRDTLKYTVVGGMEFQKPFDVVITALGWTYNKTIFHDSIPIKLVGPPWRQLDSQVYPDLTSEFESVSAPHVFVAGAAGHGLDRYRYKASGGFIHGFRFNIRSLYRILENRYENAATKESRNPSKLPLSTTEYDSVFDWNKSIRKKGASTLNLDTDLDVDLNS